MSEFIISHFLLPKASNNYKAKLLHNSSLVFLAAILIGLQFIFRFLSAPSVAVLGYAANISPQKVVELTNEERLAAGVSGVAYNEDLSRAAMMKAEDMLSQDYWAHVAPDGTEPWDFFRTVGYTYRFAGENLARDFSNPKDAIDAWLASPSHRENMLSGKYTEIGVAVAEGDLDGRDTTLIVQLFGTRSGAPGVSVASAETNTVASPAPVPQVAFSETHLEPIVGTSGFELTKVITIGVVSLLLLVLVTDVVAISRRGISRVGGRAFAHLSFMAMILVILIIVRSGEII